MFGMPSVKLACLGLILAGLVSGAATPATSLLILAKRDMTLAIVDPETLKVIAKMPSGPDPHEVAASSDGTTAYISNYGGLGSAMHSISVVDLVHQKALPAIDIGPMHSAHGLFFADGKLYFTSETNKVIGRYDAAAQKIDWVLGVGQERTHMVLVRDGGKKIFTSNVNSDTISIIEPSKKSNNPGPPGAHTPDWEETAVAVGKGPEGFDVSPDGKEVWAANSHDGSISVIDAGSQKVVATIDAKVPGSNRLKFTVDGKLVLVSSLRNGDLAVFDAATRKEVKRLKVGRGAAGILIRPDGAVAYAAASPDNSVAVVDLKTMTVVNHIEPGHEPDGMAWAVR
jgi:YVTN family beta-propeller protein